jgi:hypothetical protein
VSNFTRSAAQLAIIVMAGIVASTWLFDSYIQRAGYAVGNAILTTIEICVAVVLVRLLYLTFAGETWTIRVLAGTTLALCVITFLGTTLLIMNPGTTSAAR